MLRKMEIFWTELIITTLISLSVTAISEEFKIFRTRPDGEDGWLDGRDGFIIPSSQCQSGHITNCRQFRADLKTPTVDRCACVCPRDRATFLFHNGKWECLDNSQVRRLFGFRKPPFVTFDGEPATSPLGMVNDTDSRRLSLSNVQNCKVDSANSWSLGCYGPAAQFRNKPPFTVEHGSDVTDFPFFLSVGVNGVSNKSEFKGKIIKLGILCNTHTSIVRSLLFKYEGNINCNSTPPNLPPPPTTEPPSTTTNIQPPLQPTKLTVSKVGNVSGGRPTDPEGPPTDPEGPPTDPEGPPTDPEGPPRRDQERDTHDGPSVGLIAAFIVSILLLTIVIGFSYLGSRHFRKKPQLRPKNGGKEDAETARHRASSAYEADDENGYKALGIRGPPIYTSNYQSPNPNKAPHTTIGDLGGRRVYASSSTAEERNMHDHGGKKTSVPTLDTKDVVYKDPDLDPNLRREQSGPVRINQLVYNCMEDLKARRGNNMDPDSGLEQDPDYKDPDYRDPDYRDPDLDPDLRDKKRGPVSVNQLVYSCVEELKVAVAKGHKHDDENDAQREHHGLDGRSLNHSARPSQNGTTPRDGSDELYRNLSAKPSQNGTTSQNGRVLSKRYFDRSSRASEYGSMSRDGHHNGLDGYHLDRVARPSKYGSMSSDKKVYNYTLEKYLPPPVLHELEDYETMHPQVSSALEEDEEEESRQNGHTYDAAYGTTKF